VQPSGELPGGLSGGDDVRVARDADADLIVSPPCSLDQRLAEAGTEVALQQVGGRVHLALPAPVTARKGEQHRPAPLCGGLRLLERQQVLDPYPCAGAIEQCCDSSGRRTRLRGKRHGSLPDHLVRPQGFSLPLREGRQGLCHCRLLLGRQQPFIRGVRQSQIDHAMPVALLTVEVPPHRGHHVPGRDNGVRLQHPWFDPV
jgi:hypothetical protein